MDINLISFRPDYGLGETTFLAADCLTGRGVIVLASLAFGCSGLFHAPSTPARLVESGCLGEGMGLTASTSRLMPSEHPLSLSLSVLASSSTNAPIMCLSPTGVLVLVAHRLFVAASGSCPSRSCRRVVQGCHCPTSGSPCVPGEDKGRWLSRLGSDSMTCSRTDVSVLALAADSDREVTMSSELIVEQLSPTVLCAALATV